MLHNGIEIDLIRDDLLADYSKSMVLEFYAAKGETSPQQVYARAAKAWSTYKGVTDFEMAQRIYEYVSKKWFMFASPVLSNAPNEEGTVKGLPISCFLAYVPDTVEGLISHSSELRWLSVMGGGVGGHWGDVRSVSEIAPGPIPFLHTVDADMTAYRQGKTRKGSYAAYLDIEHPEIIEFMSLRVPTGDNNRKAFNIHNAVNISDDFMQKVVNDLEYELIDPKKGPTGEFLNARKTWQQLLEIRFRTGEPYLNFIDAANRGLPEALKSKGLKIHGSNLCNEIHLPTNEDRTAVCCLSSVNLEYYEDWKDTNMVNDLIRMLDNVLEYFIEHCPESLLRAKYSAMMERSLGLGAMGFHSYLQRHNLAFSSNKANIHNQNMFSDIKTKAVNETKKLAVERGEAGDLVGYGVRNAHLLAVAPNASSGIILSTSPSTEPHKANAYTHRTRAGSFLVKNKYLTRKLQELEKDNEEVWNSVITNGGSVAQLEFLDDHTKAVFETSFEINQSSIIELAATRQKFICQGQSVNLFFPAGISRGYVNKVHLDAWKKGLKGLYYLRTEAKQRAENVSQGVERNALADNKETIIYGKKNCPFCESAKALLDRHSIVYSYIDIQEAGKTAAEVTGRADVRTVPQIYLEGRYIGGFEQLQKELAIKVDNTTTEESDECLACQG